MRHRIDITEVEAATKIRAKYLRALENEEWDLLPGPTFVKTFLRTYAEYLELDARQLVEEYRQRFERPSTRSSRRSRPGGRAAAAPRRRRRACSGPWSWSSLGVVVACSARSTLLGRAGATTTSRRRPTSQRQADATPTPTATPRKSKKAQEPRRTTRARSRSRPPGSSTSASSTRAGKALINERDLQAGRADPDVPRHALPRHLRQRPRRACASTAKRTACPSRGEPVGYDVRPGTQARASCPSGAAADLHVSARAGIVVTGTEVLSGIISDRNGPWLSERLREHGVRARRTSMVVGDRPDDLRAALDFLAGQGVDLIVTSGGLGPTADDLTAEVVAEFAGRPLALDAALEERDLGDPRAAARPLAQPRRGRRCAPATASRRSCRDGATVLEPVGTAPGLVVPPPDGPAPTVLVLPGPAARAAADVGGGARDARRCASCWRARAPRAADPAAVRDPGVRDRALAARDRGRRRRLDGLEITTCLRRGELEIATVFEPGAARPSTTRFEAAIARAPRRHAVLRRRRRRSTSRWSALLLGRRARSRSPSRAPAG